MATLRHCFYCEQPFQSTQFYEHLKRCTVRQAPNTYIPFKKPWSGYNELLNRGDIDDKESSLFQNINLRMALDVGSKCCIFSRSHKKWYKGIIDEIFIDAVTNKEWFIVKYGNNKSKKMQRFCEYLEIIGSDGNDTVNPWKQLKSLKFNCETYVYSKLLSLNNNEFLIATEMNRLSLGNMHGLTFGGIYKYNMMNNEWNIFIKYPTNFPLLSGTTPSISFDTKTNDLYLFGLHHEKSFDCKKKNVLIKININTKEYKAINISKKYGVRESDLSSSVIINSKFHVIGGEQNECTKHNILDLKQERFCKSIKIWNRSISLSSLVYMRAENRLFAFGGYSENRISNDIWSCTVNKNKWETVPDIKIPQLMMNFGSVITSDQRYIILFGGKEGLNINTTDQEYLDKIYVLDLKTMQFDECGIQIPSGKKGEFYAVLISIYRSDNVKVLMYGYIMNYVLMGYDIVIPMDIVNVISSFWIKEYVYLLQRNRTCPELWRICVDDVLNSCK